MPGTSRWDDREMLGTPGRVVLLTVAVVLVCVVIVARRRGKLPGSTWMFGSLVASGCLTALSAVLGLLNR